MDGEFTVDLKAENIAFTGARAKISFKPKGCACKTIRLIQAVKVTDINERDAVDSRKEADREHVKTKASKKLGIAGGWHIDYFASLCTAGDGKCSIYYGDHTDPEYSQNGSSSLDGSISVDAWLKDEPSGFGGDTYSFETCARCVDDGRFLGCVYWGFHQPPRPPIKANNILDLDPLPRLNLPGTGSETPSETFTAALKAFNSFYKTSH